MKNKLLWITLGLLGAVYGCDNDANGGMPLDPPVDEPVPECVADTDCEVGVCADGTCVDCKSGTDCDSGICVDGSCAEYVGEGAGCNSLMLCPDPLVCVKGRCQQPEPEKECNVVGKSCSEGKVCIDYACVDVVHLNKGDDCTVGDMLNVCANPLICYEGKCQKDPADFTCETNEDCDHQEVFNTCVSGQCKAVVDVGQYCNDRYVCPEGYSCAGVCAKIVAEGEACSNQDYIICDVYSGFQCIEDTCQYVTDSQVLGGACDELKKCASGTVCQNGKCMTPGKEGDACDEEQLTTCAAGMMCVLGQCIPVSGECQKSEDCTEKDSYCCQSETCGAIGHCIPYDENTTHDAMCLFKTKPGIFEAQIQCRWQPPSDFESGSKSVEIPPLVGRFGNSAGLETVIAVWSYSPTVLRFIHPETCETLESIKVGLSTRWYNYPAAADFDGDGLMELVTGTSTQTYLYKWDPTANDGKGGHVLKSKASVDYRPMSSLYDIDSDGNTEIVGAFGSVIRVKKEDLSMEVLTSKDLFLDGSFLNLAIGASKDGYLNETGQDAAIGNIDADPEGIAELITAEGLYTWDGATKAWKRLLTFPWHSTTASGWVRQFPAYADFGTYHAADGSFDYQTLDGKPEIVISGKNKMQIYAIHKDDAGHWSSKSLMSVGGFTRGGPVTIGDFNNDGLPEIGIAANGTFGVYDPKCTAYKEGECADKYVMWERWSQDNSSGTTGSSLFDFDGDGQAEAVYADECYTRVYDGKTGRVLFSAPRSSVTSIEGPVIADIDNDGSTEILMASDQNYACYNDGGGSKVYSGVDPIHEGIRCEADEDCPTSKNCDKNLGLCLCETDNDCNTQYIGGQLFKQYTCTSPIHKDVGFMRNATGTASSRTMAKNRGVRPDGWASGDYKVCRAWRDTTGAKQAGVTDLMVYKDRLDRWVSSRNLWNQHAYNIINIKDDGTVTDNATWLKNWLLKKVGEYITGTTQERPKYNNYRMNEQGLYGAGTVPDITGRFILGNICGETDDGRKVISGKLCNRGTKPVATNLPATFFYYDETAPEGRGEKICTSYTPGIVGVGECQQVGCTVEESVFEGLQGKKVLMVTNLNEYDQSSTVECNYNNNTDTITIDKCEAEIEIVN